MNKTDLTSPPNSARRPDHIDYSEHMIRRIVQKNPLRSDQNLPSSIRKDFQDYHKNLPLYLHRMTAELKRKEGNTQDLKKLFDLPADQDTRIFPQVAAVPKYGHHKNAKSLKLPDSPIITKIHKILKEQEPIDYFVYTSLPVEEKKNKKEKANPEDTGNVEEKVQVIIRQKLEDDEEGKLDKLYKKYSKFRTVQKLKDLGVKQINRVSRTPSKMTAPLYSHRNPEAFKFFVTQDDIQDFHESNSEGDLADSETLKLIAKEQQEKEKIIEKICENDNVKVCEIFNIQQDEFQRKYQNQFLERIKKEGMTSARDTAHSRPAKIRMFDHMEIDEKFKHFDPRGKKMFVSAEIAKERQRNILFDQYTITRGELLNKQLDPRKNSKRRQQIILQTSNFYLL